MLIKGKGQKNKNKNWDAPNAAPQPGNSHHHGNRCSSATSIAALSSLLLGPRSEKTTRGSLTTASWWSCRAKVRSTCEGWPGGRRGPTEARAWDPPRSSPPTRTRPGWSLLQGAQISRGSTTTTHGQCVTIMEFQLSQKQCVARRISTWAHAKKHLDTSDVRMESEFTNIKLLGGDLKSLNVED